MSAARRPRAGPARRRHAARYGDAPPCSTTSTCASAPAQFTGIVGPSGSGKTTLLRAAARHGAARSPARSQRRPGLRVGYVPQVETVNWNFPVTVGECVLMARTRGRAAAVAQPRPSRREVDEVLERLGIGELADRHIRELSGGQQQRVFIARALLSSPTCC